MKVLLLWVPLPSTVNTLHNPSLGYSYRFSHQTPVLLSAKGCHSYLSTHRELNYKTKQKMLYEGSPSYTGQHTVKSQSLYYFKEKREAPALPGKAIQLRQIKCKYSQQNFHQTVPTIIYTNSVDE